MALGLARPLGVSPISKGPHTGFNDRIRLALARVNRELLDGSTEKWMNPIGYQFGSWFESEATLVEPGVGKLETGAAAHRQICKEQIEVEDSRPPALLTSPVAPQIFF
jgi:hypothetical protein